MYIDQSTKRTNDLHRLFKCWRCSFESNFSSYWKYGSSSTSANSTDSWSNHEWFDWINMDESIEWYSWIFNRIFWSQFKWHICCMATYLRNCCWESAEKWELKIEFNLSVHRSSEEFDWLWSSIGSFGFSRNESSRNFRYESDLSLKSNWIQWNKCDYSMEFTIELIIDSTNSYSYSK